jgi:hypothetical protein
VNGSKHEYASSVPICFATASAISVRPCPIAQYQRLDIASTYSLPSLSQTSEPSPRTIVMNRSRAGDAKGWRKGPVTGRDRNAPVP